MKYIIVFVFSYAICSLFNSINIITKCSTVVSIGGCNRDAYCAVVLKNGEYINISYPVVGKEACYDSETYLAWDWWLL